MAENLFKNFGEFAENCYSKSEEFKVIPEVTPEELRSLLSKYDFKAPVPLRKLFEEVLEGMEQWNIQVPHPNYYGLFNPATTKASILADAIVSLFNPQVGVWSHAPFANEVERHTLGYIGKKIGLKNDAFFGCFTTGGSEANLTATLAALSNHFPSYIKTGFSPLNIKPVFYLSIDAHNSFDKICKNVGIGTDSMRKIPVNTAWKMNTEALVAQIEQDKVNGYHPFMIIGTAGTTSAGIIDPLPELNKISKNYNLWFHVDAAWAGAIALSKRLNPLLDGIQHADSMTIDAHKWFSVPLGAGMFFTHQKQAIKNSFKLSADYMPKKYPDTEDPYTTTIQWSRRFIGLKLFMTLIEKGEGEMENMINRFADMGDYLKRQLEKKNWKVLNPTPLPVVCFTHPELEKKNLQVDNILNELYRRGKYWISSITQKDGEKVFRACITSFHTTEKHMDGLIEELEDLINR